MMGLRSVPSTVTPFLRDAVHVRRLMAFVFLAALPAAAVLIFSEGFSVFSLIVVSIAAAIVADGAVTFLRKKTLSENVWAVGLLFALTLPPTLPLPLAAAGVAGGVLLGMHLFGGMGKNWLNPVLVGRCALELLAPSEFTGASSLVALSGGAVPVLLILGGLFLIATRVTSWQVVLSVFAGAVAFPLFQTWQTTGAVQWQPHILENLLRSPFLLGAFFLAADCVTAPVTRLARIFYGLLIGGLALYIDQQTALSEGIFFSILAMNVASPVVDRIIIFLFYRGRVKKA